MTAQNKMIKTQGLDWPLIGFFALAYVLAWGSLGILSLIARQSGIDSAVTRMQMGETLQFGDAVLAGAAGILSFYFTWLFNGSGESLIPGLLFHATQNWEEGFEMLFPGLAGTDWELVSTLALLAVGVIAGVVVWRQSRGGKHG